MAAYTETNSPWIHAIHNILQKTERNLCRAKGFSKNRTKSMFTNSSEFTSTNFSLERTLNYDGEIESQLRNAHENIEESCEKIGMKLNEFKTHVSKLNKLNTKLDHIKRDTIIEIDSFERNLMKTISNQHTSKYLTFSQLEGEKELFLTEQKIQARGLYEKLHKNRSKTVNFDEICSNVNIDSTFVTKEEIFVFEDEIKNICMKSTEKCISILDEAYNQTLKRTEDDNIKTDSLLRTQESKKLSKKPRRIVEVKSEGNSIDISSTNLLKQKIKEYRCDLNSLKLSVGNNVSSHSKLLFENNSLTEIENLKQLVENDIMIKQQMDERLNEFDERLAVLENGAPQNFEKITKIPENYVKICINNMGESDDDSIGFTSPTTSPLNQLLVYGNSTRNTSKRFMFNGDTIHEHPFDEDERVSPDL